MADRLPTVLAPTAPTRAARPGDAVAGASRWTAGTAAIVVEGGAMRGVFAVGVLRGFAERQFFPFDFGIGVSSGAFALGLDLLGRSDLALEVFTEWAASGDFVSFGRFARGGSLLDLDTLGARLTLALGSPAAWRWAVPLQVCVTDVDTGQARYVQAGADTFLPLLRATTALPWLVRGFPLVADRACTDGGASDAIPVRRALELGATRVVVVRSRPRAYVKRDTWGHRLARWKMRTRPALAAAMREREARFHAVVSLMRSPPAGVQIIEICPPPDFVLGRFGRDRASLRRGFDAGIAAVDEAIREWSA